MTSSKLGLDVQNPASRGFKSVEECVKEVEKRCPATSQAFKTCNNVKKGWMNTFKGSRKKWVHHYCFTPAEREKRAKELRCGLPAKVVRLLRKSKSRKAEVKGVAQQSGGEEVQGGVEVDEVNPEDVEGVDQQSGVNNYDGVFEEGKLVHCGGVSNLHCDVEEQQATDADGEMVKGGRGFNAAFDVDGEEIAKETIGDVAEEVAEAVSYTHLTLPTKA